MRLVLRKGLIGAGFATLLVTLLVALTIWAWRTAALIDLHRIIEPSLVYAAGRVIGPGLSVTATDLIGTLGRLGYEEVTDQPREPAQFRREANAWEIFLRARDDPRVQRPALRVRLELERDRVSSVVNSTDGTRLEGIELEPELLGDLGELAHRVRRPVRLAAVSTHLITAVLAAEDRRFFDHPGVDVRAVFRALVANLGRGKVVQGGSTLTQQLVKSLGVSAPRSWARKLGEALVALALERRYSKAEILEAYLNIVYLGQHGHQTIHGVGAAAVAYFQKDVGELDLSEAAMLAGIIHGPNKYSPWQNPDPLRERRDVVLRRMRQLGLIDEPTFITATERAVHLQPDALPQPLFPYFLVTAYSQLQQILSQTGGRLDGLQVYTSLDPALQRAAETSLVRYLNAFEQRIPQLRRSDPTRRLQGVLVALDPATGEIRALVGGRDYRLSQFNRATQARRQPGSTFKPFVYLAALRAGPRGEPPALTAASVVEDRPLALRVVEGSWTPRNVQRSYLGKVSVRGALERSLNAATVAVAQTVGLDAVIRSARDAGLTSPMAPLPSLSLGAFEVTPLELAAAYATFASLGKRVSPTAIRAIVDGPGSVTRPGREPGGTAIRAGEAFLLTNLLVGVMERGSGEITRLLGASGRVAGKTGSTKRDAWFVAYTPRLVTLVWVGFDNGDALELSGAWALLIWWDFMRTAMTATPNEPFSVPPSVVFADVNPTNGKLASPFCPVAIREAFLPSTVPTEVCSEHGARVSLVPAR
jgi:penicillin-binding protein 1B